MSFNNLLNQILGTAQKGNQSVSNSPPNSFTGGTLATGLASMLIKKKNTQKLVRTSSVTALGYIVYKGYQSWQQNRDQSELPQQASEPARQLVEIRSHVILCAMIATAASDKLIDEVKKQVIARENDTDVETTAWLVVEYEKPVTVEELAVAVGNDKALTAETYLATGLVCANLSRKEITFLTRLSQALGSDGRLAENLEKQLDLA